MKKLKIAVIGVGNISNVHIKVYLQRPDVEVYAFCDINESRVKYMGEKYGVTRLYTDEATMLAELPEIDAVSVCTWNSAHAACSIMALNAGKHVLCEKPMAMTVEEAMAMKEAAERNQRLLMIGFVRRFENGAILSVETSFSLNMEQKSDTGMQFFGTAAGVDYDKDIHLFSELDGYLTNVELADLKMSSFDECFSKEIGHFIDCINGKATCLNPAEDGVEMMKILCAIYRSAESGHEEVL